MTVRNLLCVCHCIQWFIIHYCVISSYICCIKVWQSSLLIKLCWQSNCAGNVMGLGSLHRAELLTYASSAKISEKPAGVFFCCVTSTSAERQLSCSCLLFVSIQVLQVTYFTSEGRYSGFHRSRRTKSAWVNKRPRFIYAYIAFTACDIFFLCHS